MELYVTIAAFLAALIINLIVTAMAFGKYKERVNNFGRDLAEVKTEQKESEERIHADIMDISSGNRDAREKNTADYTKLELLIGKETVSRTEMTDAIEKESKNIHRRIDREIS